MTYERCRAILHDEEVYPDPLSFKPERFLDKNGELDSNVQTPFVAAFGFGRRICPGQHMASDSAFITIASILAAFDIKQATDPVTGLPVPVSEKMILKVTS